jgi:CrcB protein
MQTWIMIGAGSFIGGGLRYFLSQVVQSKMLSVFPYGTFAVNVIGCFVIGAVISLADKQSMSNDWKLFWPPAFVVVLPLSPLFRWKRLRC